MERCENCGSVIGKLETPHVWRNSIVCRTCAARLHSAPARPVLPLKTGSPVWPVVLACCVVIGGLIAAVVFSHAKEADKERRQAFEVGKRQLDVAVARLLDDIDSNRGEPSLSRQLEELDREGAMAIEKLYREVSDKTRLSVAGQWRSESEFKARLDKAAELVRTKKKEPYQIDIYRPSVVANE
jgi:hypothetical protein